VVGGFDAAGLQQVVDFGGLLEKPTEHRTAILCCHSRLSRHDLRGAHQCVIVEMEKQPPLRRNRAGE
jgi:hypothetical protein